MKNLTAILALFSALSTHAALFTITVDDMETGAFNLSGNGQTDADTGAPESIIGGTRTARLYNDDGSFASLLGGIMTFDKNDNSALTLNYGSYAQQDESKHLHLDVSSLSLFAVEVGAITSPVYVSIDLYSYTDGKHRYSGDTQVIEEPGTHYLIFRRNGIADYTDVAGLQFAITGGFERYNTEISISEIGFLAVPEPSTYAACFGVGLMGFAGWRRFRK